jgi:DNA invertase Pin-like site-specific DNA recombinase
MSQDGFSQSQADFETLTNEIIMSTIGYARVSSYGQSLDVQLEKLKHCDRIFQEKQSGRSTDKRVQLALCVDYVRDGDTLVVTKLDRLARSTRDLLNILNTLEKKQVKLHVLDQQIDTSTPSGRLLVTMLGSIAEFENDLRKDRQADGIAHARKNGVKFGRKKALTDDQVLEMRQKRSEGVKIKELMSRYALSKASVYRALTDSGELQT